MTTKREEKKWERRHGTSEQIFYGLVRKYDVTVKEVPVGWPPPDGVTRGPKGHACSPSTRTIFLNPRDTRHSAPYYQRVHGINWEPENYLHELVHVITQPPWQNIEHTPEDFILMQFERALAAAYFSPWAYDRIVHWQECTEVSATGTSLGTLTELGVSQPYFRAAWWRAGFVFCRKLGILDENNRPTFRWPDWRIIDKKASARIMDWYFGDEPASLLSIAQGL